MAADADSRSSSSPKGADPMAEHKRRARWRFLGALVIAGAVALVAPFFLEEQARPLSQDLLIEIPSKSSVFGKIDSLKSDSATPIQAQAPSPTQPQTEPKSEPPPQPPPQPQPKSQPKSQPQAPAQTQPQPQAKPEIKPSVTSEAKGFMVQVGAYAKPEAAAAVKTKLESGGHKVSIEVIRLTDGAERHRVRIGPFESREQAIEVRDRAKAQGYDAAIINL